MRLSIVATMYYSAEYLETFSRLALAEAEALFPEVELVLVNDGSPDRSLEVAVGLMSKDARIRIVDLSRNFGHYKAIMTGLAHARGDLVFLIDCDLEEDPRWLRSFHALMAEKKADVVFGVQRRRKGRAFERVSGGIFWRLINILSQSRIHANQVTARLMSRPYVDALVSHQEREVFLAGLWAITGFNQEPMVVDKGSKGSTTYSLTRKFALLVNAVTSFSNKPLHMVFWLGLTITAAASISALLLIIRAIFFGGLLQGWPSLMVSIWFLGGVTIFCLGVIGVYLAKVFSEVKQRPYAIVRRLYEAEVKPLGPGKGRVET